MLNGLPEKDHQIITEITSESQNRDTVTIVTMDKLSKNSELKKILQSNAKVALINYSKNILNSDFLKKKLAEDGIKFSGNEVLDALVEFSKFSSEDILENELEKLKIFKLYDDKPLTTEDFFDVVSTNYELNESEKSSSCYSKGYWEHTTVFNSTTHTKQSNIGLNKSLPKHESIVIATAAPIGHGSAWIEFC